MKDTLDGGSDQAQPNDAGAPATSFGDGDDALGELFTRLQAEVDASDDTEATLSRCARLIEEYLPGAGSDRLRHDMKTSGGAITRYLAGDPSGLGEVFDSIVNADGAGLGEDRFFFILVKHVADESRYVPLAVHCRLNPRVWEAQSVLRSEAFVRRLARRLGVESFPAEVLRSKVQGVEVIHYAGHQRYAVFSDFVAGLGREGCNTRGGMLLQVLSDEFVEIDLPVVAETFPRDLRRLEDHGLLEPAVLRFLFPVYAALHDTLGHTLPNPLTHPTKVAAGAFWVDPLEEVGADAQSLWAATSPEAKPFLRQIMGEEEIEAIPVVWLMKRVCHYPRRGFSDDSPGGRLMSDSDARCGVLLYNFFRETEAIRGVEDGFEIDRARLPAACDALLDAWIEIESHIGEGVDGYRAALEAFTHRYGSAGADGSWTVPEELQRAYRRVERPGREVTAAAAS